MYVYIYTRRKSNEAFIGLVCFMYLCFVYMNRGLINVTQYIVYMFLLKILQQKNKNTEGIIMFMISYTVCTMMFDIHSL